MKVMVMIQGAGADEDKIKPTEEMFTAMGAYNDELIKAGILLDGNGLLPTATGARVVFEGETTSVVDGPFTESKEIVAGYWVWEVSSLEEAVEWAKRCPSDPDAGLREVLEIRRIAEAEDFGDAYTEEQRAEDERRAAEVRSRQSG